MNRLRAFSVFMLCAALFASRVQAENWPRWRGPHGNGHYDAKLPVRWSEKDLVWRVALPGAGQSSPSIWGNRLFLTTSLAGGVERRIMCYDTTTGKLLWTDSPVEDAHPERIHRMNSYASATCAANGKYVVAFFGHAGIYCYDLAGRKVWSHAIGNFAGPWGTAASPVLVDDMVVQNCDADEEAFLIAFDIATGKQLWKTARRAVRGWSTPLLVESAGRKILVVNGHTGMTAYDSQTGKELWYAKGDRGRGTPTVAPYKNTLIAVSGRPGDMWAVRTGGSGDVSATNEVWRTSRRGARDLPSPIVVGDYLFVVAMNGISTCYQASTGEELERFRLKGKYSASPVAAGGLTYVLDEAGGVAVLRLGLHTESVAKNSCPKAGEEEIFRASPAMQNGRIFLRSNTAIYCIGGSLSE